MKPQTRSLRNHVVILHSEMTASWQLRQGKRRILMYLGDRHLKTDGIDVWPLNRFTAAVADGSLWP